MLFGVKFQNINITAQSSGLQPLGRLIISSEVGRGGGEKVLREGNRRKKIVPPPFGELGTTLMAFNSFEIYR